MDTTFDVSEIMQQPVETIAATAPLVDAAVGLAEGIGSLVVTRDGDHTGIVTKTDVVGAFAREESDVAVGEAMSTPVTTVREADSILDAALVLAGRGVSQAPVLDENAELVGIVSVRELAYYVPDLQFRAIRQDADATTGEARVGREGRPGGESRAAGEDRHGHVRRPGRVDTAYEETRWSFEYDGGDGIAVGDVASFSKPITEADVEEFAHATGDTNRLHLDESFADGTRFGRRIAHGVLSLGLVSAALARMPGAIIYLSQDCSYLGPVDLHTRVTARCEVAEDLGRDRYRIDISASTDDGDEVLSGGSTILVDEIPA